jgi:hypothetical protein
MHLEGYGRVSIIRQTNLDLEKQPDPQLPTALVHYDGSSGKSGLIQSTADLPHRFHLTFTSLPSKSSTAVPVCFGTFSNSSIVDVFRTEFLGDQKVTPENPKVNSLSASDRKL